MADLGDTVNLNGKVYRTEQGHEAALRELYEQIMRVAAQSAPASSGADLDYAMQRLDAQQKLIRQIAADLKTAMGGIQATRERVAQPAQMAIPASLAQRLDAVLLASEGVPKRLDGQSGHLATLETVVGDMGGKLDYLTQRLGGISERVVSLDDRLDLLAGQVRLLVDVLDAATDPAASTRVPPQVKPSDSNGNGHSGGEVQATPTPFRRVTHAEAATVLREYLTTPTLTTKVLGPRLGMSEEGARQLLHRAAAREGLTGQLKARAALGQRHKGAPSSLPAVDGPAIPASTVAGSCG